MIKTHDELMASVRLHEAVEDIINAFDMTLKGHQVEHREAILRVVRDYVSREYGD